MPLPLVVVAFSAGCGAVVEQIVADRFQNAPAKGRKLLSHHVVRGTSNKDRVEFEPFLLWQSQSLTLLETVFGPDHTFRKSFETFTTLQSFPQAFVGHVQKSLGVLVGTNYGPALPRALLSRQSISSSRAVSAVLMSRSSWPRLGGTDQRRSLPGPGRTA